MVAHLSGKAEELLVIFSTCSHTSQLPSLWHASHCGDDSDENYENDDHDDNDGHYDNDDHDDDLTTFQLASLWYGHDCCGGHRGDGNDDNDDDQDTHDHGIDIDDEGSDHIVYNYEDNGNGNDDD